MATHSFAARRTTRANQSGVGLIEVLVAVLVLSIGFLGIAALQAMSLSTNNSAMARSMATINSYSMFDAMRADPAVAKSGGYNASVTADACPDAGTSLAGAQIHDWCAQLGTALGAEATTKGKIACEAGGTGNCSVTITFNDSRAAVGGSATQTIVTKALL